MNNAVLYVRSVASRRVECRQSVRVRRGEVGWGWGWGAVFIPPPAFIRDERPFAVQSVIQNKLAT